MLTLSQDEGASVAELAASESPPKEEALDITICIDMTLTYSIKILLHEVYVVNIYIITYIYIYICIYYIIL